MNNQQNDFVPKEIKGWNWIPLLFIPWRWAQDNHLSQSIVALSFWFYPIMGVVLAAKGNQWAWRSQKFSAIEEFKETQRKLFKIYLRDYFYFPFIGILLIIAILYGVYVILY